MFAYPHNHLCICTEVKVLGPPCLPIINSLCCHSTASSQMGCCHCKLVYLDDKTMGRQSSNQMRYVALENLMGSIFSLLYLSLTSHLCRQCHFSKRNTVFSFFSPLLCPHCYPYQQMEVCSF